MPDYTKGKIYRIYNTITNDIYIGATTQLLCQRMKGHREACKVSKNINIKLYKSFKEHGIQRFYIVLLENFNCNSKEELSAKEGQYIRELRPALNTKIEGRTLKQYYVDNIDKFKQYKLNNLDKIKEQQKQYYDNNIDKIKEHEKQYYVDNIDKIKARDKQYYDNN